MAPDDMLVNGGGCRYVMELVERGSAGKQSSCVSCRSKGWGQHSTTDDKVREGGTRQPEKTRRPCGHQPVMTCTCLLCLPPSDSWQGACVCMETFGVNATEMSLQG